jgi:NTP pyrophosphatase (non-canonical NTP hydrolase)
MPSENPPNSALQPVRIVPIDQIGLLDLNEFQRYTRLTDQNPRSGTEGLHLPLLGLFGEVGGLLSELKKKQRDKDSYFGYRESVIEEFGDVLWYFANISDRAGLDLSILAQRSTQASPDRDGAESRNVCTFADIESKRDHQGPVSDAAFEHCVLNLAAKTGIMLQHFSTGTVEQNCDVLSADLVEIFKALLQAADHADISLQDAAKGNLRKIWSRWPSEKVYPPLFDTSFPTEEQLPRTLTVTLQEKVYGERVFVMQQANGINIGDRLTDNIAEPDDYRFHDVFHWTYAAILGWSPVTRALLKLKRKSSAATDENQDGSRAQLIEEGVATWIFNHGRSLNFYENVSSVDYRLLKSIQEFVKGYEVAKCPLWVWEEAILKGFRSFRFLRQHRGAVLHLDLQTRTTNINLLH